MTGALTQLRQHAKILSEQGRHGDTELVHMSKAEVGALQRLSPTGRLTTNPDTGLPEAFSLGSILGSIGGALLPVVMPGISDSVGGALGLTDLLGPNLGSAAGGALLGGGLGLLGSALSGGKNMGLAAGLGALGGGLTSYFSPEISGALGTDGNAGGLLSGLFGTGDSSVLSGSYSPSSAWDAGGGGTDFNSAGAPSAAAGAGSTAGASGSSWISKNWPLLAGGLLLAGMAGGSKQQSTPKLTQAQKDQQAANASPAVNYAFNRTPVPALMNPTQWYTLGNQSSGQPILFFNNPAGTYTPTGTPIVGKANGGTVYAQGGLAALRGPRYVAGDSGGQDDSVPARLSDGEYVIDAATVSDLGDGNNAAGAQKLDQLRQAVAKHKGRKQVVPPRAKSLTAYLGGSV